MKTGILTITTFVILASCPMLKAATISWSDPQTISGVSDISTAGTLVAAWSWGNPSPSAVTVNGVSFESLNWTGGGTQTGSNLLASSSGEAWTTSSTAYGSAFSPFSSLESSYKTILSGASVSFWGSTDILLTGLTIGVDYEFQFWINYSSVDADGMGGVFDQIHMSDVLFFNTTLTDGGVGQFITGSFTANSATQELRFLPTMASQFNAGQLRMIPEPSSELLLVLGLGFVGFFIQRRSKSRTAW